MKPKFKTWEEERQYAGGFKRAVMEAVEHADGWNLARLYLAFPAMVDLFVRDRYGLRATDYVSGEAMARAMSDTLDEANEVNARPRPGG